MRYLIALILPPVAVLLTGRVITASILGVLWFVLTVLTYGLAHIVFVILAWVLIASSIAERRHKQILKSRE